MSTSGFQFDAKQQYQLDAIQSVVDLFDGQPKDVERLVTSLRVGDPRQIALELGEAAEIGAIGNNLVLDHDVILANLQRVQDRNGLEVIPKLFDGALDFDIEMETGTGKTYVYLRTMFELARQYSFTKFIILVPSVAIREGVSTSIRLMRKHFRELYPDLPFDATIYRGDSAEEVQSFATSTSLQILIMTIASIRGDKNNRIIHQTRDKLNGLRPIDYLRATRPVVIMDEPQNMESELSQSSIGDLDPAFTLRYSATHKKKRNVAYRLDAKDAHDLGLVKQIEVDDVRQKGADATPYIKLVSVKRDPWVARLELACRKADGSIERREVNVPPHRELSDSRISDNPVYEGWRINQITTDPPFVELNLWDDELYVGETIGGSSEAVFREMIVQTVREHMKRASQLRDQGIKVLSLFFVDKVSSFLGTGTNNEDANGDFVKWFDEAYNAERNSRPKYQELFPHEAHEVRKAYFAQLKKGGKTTFIESNPDKTSAKDDGAFELIMQDKERLLAESEPVRFIFSHSALREGWDNPNVFQICSLREMGRVIERRQTIGRGLRLPVAMTEDGFIRIADRSVATLTVVGTESMQDFAKSLQTEMREAGVELGYVRKAEFSKIAKLDANGDPTDDILGYNKSAQIWEHLTAQGFLKDGKPTDKFQPDLFTDLELPDEFKAYQDSIRDLIAGSGIERYVKDKKNRISRKLNKQLYTSPDFEAFWEAISRKTTYRVTVSRDDIIMNSVRAIQESEKVEPLRIEVSRAKIKILRGGVKAQESNSPRITELRGSYDLPDIISELQEATSLTRATIIDILIGSGRLEEFIGNPNDFIALVKRKLQDELAKLVVNGIQYERIAGYVYELRELQKDGEEEKERFLDQLYKVQNLDKSDFDYVTYDSDPERQFAELLDGRDDIKLFMKLPSKFKIPTPVGPYNPDWAIIKQVDGEDRIYLVRETKSTLDDTKLRPTELAKIKSAKKHFVAIGLEGTAELAGYDRSVPGKWKI